MSAAVATTLILTAPGLPLLLALVWPLPRLRRWVMPLAPWAAAPAMALALVRWVTPGGLEMTATLPGTSGSLRLALDATGQAFLLLTSILWLVGGIFARSYHAKDPERESFFGFFLLTMAGNLGLVCAADLLTFYLFFALMTFSAYGLIIHDREEEAYRAGRIYVVLAVLADVALLTALFSLAAAGSAPVHFGPELDAAWGSLAETGRIPGARLSAWLLILGFGVKAGLAPLHVWLPLAHPVAPTVASALLSGAMIKAGILGWIRFLPESLAFPALGATLIILGVSGIFYGVLMGLPQDDAKTVLAYSSVSQMGFLTVAIGAMVYEPEIAAVALGAAALYALHHGLAKGALFLSVGLADHAPKWRGGRWRGAVLLLALVPSLAISGAPFTTGARAKGALEKVLEELGGGWYEALHPLLLVAAFATTVLLARFLVVLDRRALQQDAGREDRSPWGLAVPWTLLVLIGATALFWIQTIAPSPELEVPPILHTPLLSLGPVVAGALLAWGVYRRPSLLGPLARLRVPPGDLVVPVEALLQRVPSLSQQTLREKLLSPLRKLHGIRSRAARAAQFLADHDLLLMRGAVFGAILLFLAVLLTLAAFS